MNLETRIGEYDRPILGDCLRLLFFAAREHPVRAVRQAVLKALSAALDDAGAPKCSMAKFTTALKAVQGPPIAPMTFLGLDVPVIAQFWRICMLMEDERVVIGSADAVGEGYGAVLDEKLSASYMTREQRVPRRGRKWNSAIGDKQRPALNLNLVPLVQHAKLSEKKVSAHLTIDKRKGIALVISSEEALPESFKVLMHSWIAEPAPGAKKQKLRESLHSIGLAAEEEAGRGRIILRPQSPEATIRFAVACAGRANVCLRSTPDTDYSKHAWLVGLLPQAQGDKELVVERHSCDGALAEWLRIAPYPLSVALDDETRQRIAEWLHASEQSVGRDS